MRSSALVREEGQTTLQSTAARSRILSSLISIQILRASSWDSPLPRLRTVASYTSFFPFPTCRLKAHSNRALICPSTITPVVYLTTLIPR